MAKRSSGVALYELIRPPKPPQRANKPKRRTSVSKSSTLPAWLSPGHTIRLPIGYLCLATVVGVVALVAAYGVGYARARPSEEAGQVGGWAAPADLAQSRPGPEKPMALRTHQATTALPTPTPPATSERAAKRAGPLAVEQTPLAAANQPAPVFGDPRTPGKSYFVIAETHAAGAERLARYCRSEGLEAYVIGADTDKFRKVIILPGFEPDIRSDPTVKTLETTIHRVGDKWKGVERGASNLRDAYALLFRG